MKARQLFCVAGGLFGFQCCYNEAFRVVAMFFAIPFLIPLILSAEF
jgi:hypothetical protein